MYKTRLLQILFIRTGIFVFFVFLTTSCLFKKESRSVTGEERNLYINQLKESLEKTKYQKESIELAEYLIDLQYTQYVYDFFSRIDLTHNSITPSFKSGVYRVLALSAQNEKDRMEWNERLNYLPENAEDQEQNVPLSGFKSTSERYLMVTALTKDGKTEDISLLKTIFSEELKDGTNQDVLNAAAYAILKIDRNEPYNLATLDWTVIVLYFAMMVMIGVYYSRKNKSLKDFALGGKTMGFFSIGLSLFATMLSSLSYLSYPGEMIRYGPIIFAGMFAFPITHWVVGWFIIPKFMKEDVTSAYELLEKKLGLSIRFMASFFFISLRFLWMATIIFATVDTAIGSMLDINPFQRFILSTILLVCTLIYSSIGGLKAVVMTDVIQTFLLWIGAILTIVIISLNLGSFTNWIPDHWLAHWSPLKWGFNATERLTIGNAMLMLFVWYICTSGSDQMAIQRYLATRDLKAARRSFGIALLSNLFVKILLGLVGLALLAFFFKNPHLLKPGKGVLEQSDNFFPRFIIVGFPVGLAGLVFAGILAAAMSSLSGGLNSTAVVISEDWLKKFRKKSKKPVNELKKIKILSATVGIIVLVLSFAIGYLQGNLFDIIQKTANLFVAPLFVLFFMALFIPFSTEKGTFIAGLSSVFFAASIAFGEFMGIKTLWIMPSSLIFGIVAGIISSYIEVIILKTRQRHL